MNDVKRNVGLHDIHDLSSLEDIHKVGWIKVNIDKTVRAYQFCL